jgi:hypothetical protein
LFGRLLRPKDGRNGTFASASGRKHDPVAHVG